MFEHKEPVTVELRHVVNRHEAHGGEDVPAISLGVSITGPYTILDMLDPEIAEAILMEAPGQARVPGTPRALTKLRSKSFEQWTLSKTFVYDGWLLHVMHAASEPFRLGKCKVHKFVIVKAADGGEITLNYTISTSDCDETIAGWLWARQMKQIEIALFAPKQPVDIASGKKTKAKKEDPKQGKLEPDPTGAFIASQGEQPKQH